MDNIRKGLNGMKADDAVETVLNLFARTKNNEELIQMVKKTKFIQTNIDSCATINKLCK